MENAIMRPEEEIRERISELEYLSENDPDIMDEGLQSELMTLYWVMGCDEV